MHAMMVGAKPMRRAAFSLLVFCLPSITANAQDKAQWGTLSGKVFDEKSKKPVADAIVYLKPLAGNFPIHADDKVRKDLTLQIPAGRTFDFRMVGHFPYYMDGEG